MAASEDPIKEIKDSRNAIDDILSVMHRRQHLDDDTRSLEVELQTLIEREFERIDRAVADLDE
ncbi:hypothetical protein [Halorussus marinus]|uniref:hypothetical protein n=1 Tax=Halorussus marinus TaxID=2505976 RepID=UPI00106E008A|nr:hypothetical protein [Halorussus marinus]